MVGDWYKMTIAAAIPAFNEEIAIGSVIARAKQHVSEVVPDVL
jgi:hypothetical protein